MYEDEHLEMAYEDRFEVDGWDPRDYAEEAENAAIDRDDDGPDFPPELILTGDDMEHESYCDANARKGTGTGACDRPLDKHGQCDRAGSHL